MMIIKKYARLVCLLVLCTLLPVTGFGLSLEEAKLKGMVGEEQSGYLGAVVASPEATQVVNEINAKRREKYQQIAKQNGTPVATVEALAGKKAIENTPPGGFIKSPSGSWVKK